MVIPPGFQQKLSWKTRTFETTNCYQVVTFEHVETKVIAYAMALKHVLIYAISQKQNVVQDRWMIIGRIAFLQIPVFPSPAEHPSETMIY